MGKKQGNDTTTDDNTPLGAISKLQEAGLGNMLEMNTAWVDALGDMGAEVIGFVAQRIKEDVKTQQKILHCNNMTDLQQIQAQFIQRAIDQYQAETKQLVEMSTKVFAPKEDDGP